MKINAIGPALVVSFLLLSCVSSIGCSSSSAGAALPFEAAEAGVLQGNWEYLVTNAFSATFENCTGDAAILEGYSFSQASALAPMCVTAVKFNVNQLEDAFEVEPYGVQCSDGHNGSATGLGQQLSATDIVGQWESTSSTGVTASQTFSGSVVGNTISVVETARTFSGSFEGDCELSPPLKATVTVIQ